MLHGSWWRRVPPATSFLRGRFSAKAVTLLEIYPLPNVRPRVVAQLSVDRAAPLGLRSFNIPAIHETRTRAGLDAESHR